MAATLTLVSVMTLDTPGYCSELGRRKGRVSSNTASPQPAIPNTEHLWGSGRPLLTPRLEGTHSVTMKTSGRSHMHAQGHTHNSYSCLHTYVYTHSFLERTSKCIYSFLVPRGYPGDLNIKQDTMVGESVNRGSFYSAGVGVKE